MIRQLTQADLPAFRALLEQGLAQEPLSFLLTAKELRAIPEQDMAPGFDEGRHFGAFLDGDLVAIASIKRGGVARLRHMADLGPIYVAPQARRRGFARGLVCAAIEAAQAAGLLQLELAVDAQNAGAIALYETLGFVRFGLRPRSVIVAGVPRDDVLMLRRLD
ncbi:MAG: GNAT family N-acetyltransferase [Pelagimonas sp.]|jgi:ribosomal protein S18 acetylase RimI-like enzyme|nr:GNAT family N-acetyltransferase [Pelagimonas sp.]